MDFLGNNRQMVKSTFIMFLFILLLLTATSIVFAEPAEEEYTADEVIVTATKIEQPQKDIAESVSVITQDMISNSNANSVADLLPMVPGVAVTNQYGGLGGREGIAIRGINGGADSQKMLILIDGRPANGGFKGTVNWNSIPLANVEKIEVVRGPASVLYGNNAFGGAVNIITKKPQENFASYHTSFGSWGTKTLSLFQTGKNGNDGYTFTADYGSTDGFRDNSAYEGANFTLRYDFGDNTIVRAGYNTFDRKNPGTEGVVEPTDWTSSSKSDYKPWDRDKVNAQYFDFQHNFMIGKLPSQLRFYYNETDSENYAEETVSTTKKINNKNTKVNNYDHTWDLYQTLKDKTQGLQFQQTISESDKQNILWGSDFQWLTADVATYHTTSGVNVAGEPDVHKAKTSAFYIQDNQQLSAKLRMDLGGRYDNHSVYGGQFDPKFGLAYQAQDDTVLKFNVSRAFMAPSMNDLYYANGANSDLKPERMWSYEVGVEKQFSLTSKASLTLYKEDVTDLIRKVQGGLKENLDSATPQGVEFEWVRKANDHINYFLNYTYLDMGLYTKYSAKHKGAAGINYINGPWKIYLAEQYVGKSYDDDLKTNPDAKTIAAYALTNIKFTFTPDDNHEWSVGIDNLFNKAYENLDYEPLPGRYYVVSFTGKI